MRFNITAEAVPKHDLPSNQVSNQNIEEAKQYYIKNNLLASSKVPDQGKYVLSKKTHYLSF